ncbi:MAG: hypothetical protein ACI4II_10285 [Acutalibacteraceae bacterium]
MRRKEIALELTPLLDVILTLLFMVLISVTQQVQSTQQEAQRALDEANEKIELAEKKILQLNQSAVSMELLQDNCKIVTIAAYNDKDVPGERTITIKDNNDEEPYEIRYDWTNLTFAKNAFKQTLTNSYLTLEGDEQIIFIVFQYDSKSIYNYDYSFINSVLSTVNADRPEVYLVYYNIPLSVINGENSSDNTNNSDTTSSTVTSEYGDTVSETVTE